MVLVRKDHRDAGGEKITNTRGGGVHGLLLFVSRKGEGMCLPLSLETRPAALGGNAVISQADNGERKCGVERAGKGGFAHTAL